jgi:hypothetical protein
MGRAIAKRTSGGTGVGPGAKRYRFSIARSSFEKADKLPTEKEVARYHLHWEGVKKSGRATDDVFRVISYVEDRGLVSGERVHKENHNS